MANNQTETDAENSRNGWPMREPRWWFSLSLTLLCLLLVFLLFSAWYVFDGSTLPTGAKDKVDILWRIGAGLIAFITFITVIWRGMMTDQQTREQKRQNDANDDAAYASLLVEGTKLLGEDNDHHKRAGVAILLRVIKDPSSDKEGRPNRLQQQATDILASEWSQNYKLFNIQNYTAFLYSALFTASKNKLFASFNLNCKDTHLNQLNDKGKPKTQNKIRWIITNVFRDQIYTGGIIQMNRFKDIIKNENKIRFIDTKIFYSDIDQKIYEKDIRFVDCIYDNCKITIFRTRDIFGATFICCDFSGCKIVKVGGSTEVTMGYAKFLNDQGSSFEIAGNWYDVERPPISDDGFENWNKYLQPRKKVDDIWHSFNVTSGTWEAIEDTPF